MKKVACILLILINLLLGCGMSVHYNYCKGRLTNVSVGLDADCPMCAKKKAHTGKCGCCNKIVKIVKVEIDRVAAAGSLAVSIPAELTLSWYPPREFDFSTALCGCAIIRGTGAPPVQNDAPVFIANRTLLI